MKKYHNVGTIIKSNITIVERGKIDTPNTQIHDPHFVLYYEVTFIKGENIRHLGHRPD
jgi:hypothetical protein